MQDALLKQVHAGTHSLAQLMALMKENWPEALSEDTDPVIAVIRLGQLVTDNANRIAASYGLTHAAFEALTTLRAMPEPRQMTPTQLYRAALVTSGGMTKVLKQLEDKGFITRHDNPDDKRSRFVRLTPEGEAVIEATMAAVLKGDEDMLARALDDTDRKQLRSLLFKALDRLEG